MSHMNLLLQLLVPLFIFHHLLSLGEANADDEDVDMFFNFDNDDEVQLSFGPAKKEET